MILWVVEARARHRQRDPVPLPDGQVWVSSLDVTEPDPDLSRRMHRDLRRAQAKAMAALGGYVQVWIEDHDADLYFGPYPATHDYPRDAVRKLRSLRAQKGTPTA